MSSKLYINYGVTTFDSLGTSLLTVFQMITSETWQVTLINLLDVDLPILGFLYVFFIIVVGQFFLLNLILAVIIEAFINLRLNSDFDDDDRMFRKSDDIDHK